ncbi:MAG: aldehyde dehydrogenase family protein [Nitrospinota bacterium]
MNIYKNYINGEWVDSVSGEVFENKNPAHKEEVIGVFQKSVAEDVEKGVAAAAEAAEAWKKTPAPKRGEILFKIGETLVRKKKELARDMTREMGKVLKETLGDVQEAIDMTYYIAGEGRRLLGETTPSELPDKFCMTIRIPVGIVAAITPWNFPMAIPSWKLLPALMAGNTVVFKPATDTPLSAVNFIKIFEECGLPRGVLNLITGSGKDVGEPLITHNEVKLISFTGSTEVGQGVASLCARDIKRYSLEMGGKNAIIVMDDADLDLAVEGAVWGAFGTTGQRCTAASRLVVHKDVVKRFTNKLISKTGALRLGDGLLDSTDVGPVINENQLNKIHEYTQIGIDEGAKLLTGGEICKEGDCADGYFYKPTIFTDVERYMRIAREEIFGPTVVIIIIGSLEEAIDVVNDTEYGLSSAIYTQDVNKAFIAMRDIYTGITYINSSTIGAEIQLPFGGTKGTGNGHREAGTTVFDIFTEWKSIYVDFSGKLQKAQIAG